MPKPQAEADCIRYCNKCGAGVRWQTPAGDQLPRHVCVACGHVQYRNPRMIAGIVVESTDRRILLCRRGIAPKIGCWTFPAGFLENGESSAEGARREALEEAGVRVEDQGLYMVIEVRAAHEVHLVHRGRLALSTMNPGPECAEARLFGEDEVPWEALAYPAIETCLRQYFSDRRGDRFPIHVVDVIGEAVAGEPPAGRRGTPVPRLQAG